jgi:hypothetical protein
MRMKNLEKYRIGGHLLEREIGHPDPRPGAHRKVVPIAILRTNKRSHAFLYSATGLRASHRPRP